MTVRLYDSARREVIDLAPLNPGRVGLYTCGPTTQGSPHLGHLRTYLAVDVLVRWLRRQGVEVRYIRNVTDIDDKILARSAELGRPWWEWSLHCEREFHTQLSRLGCVEPSYEPRATGHVPEMIALITRLIERGHAYADGEGSVYFDVRSFSRYGELTRQSAEDMQDGDEEQVPGKRDRRDFALWKRAKDDEPDTAAWDTPYGRGRPGWHLECSAMAHKYLGESFDIHAGGLDLRFPHHENEMAQSRAAGYGFAGLWMHTGMLTVNGMKMGKSLDNFVTAQDALAAHSAPAVRLALVGSHYRAAVEYNEATVHAAEVVWERLVHSVARAVDVVGDEAVRSAEDLAVPQDFAAAMNDDLGTPQAMAVVHRVQAALNTAVSEGDKSRVCELLGELRSMLDVLGLDPLDEQWISLSRSGTQGGAEHEALDALVRSQLDERAQARAQKNWARADEIRDALSAAGIQVADGRDGASWSIIRREGE